MVSGEVPRWYHRAGHSRTGGCLKVRRRGPVEYYMQSLSQERIRNSRIKAVLVFVMHQFIGSWGVAAAATFLVYFSFEILRPLNPRMFTSHNSSWLLTDLPYFPMQIVLGLWSGWSFGRRFQHRAMLWAWILPFAFLCYALLAIPTMTPDFVPLILQAGVGQSRLSHYFGWGCRPEDRCLDQLGITMPFYVSVSYSIGALLARRMPTARGAGVPVSL